jgi:AcrR family transcriptional regulator
LVVASNVSRAEKTPSLRDRLRQATYAAILQAAEDTIAERGLRAAGMVEIAARAGVAVGTLYNHFEDRDALVAALLASRRGELLERLDEAVADGGRGKFADRLLRVTEIFFAHFEAHRRLIQVLFQEPVRGAPERQQCEHSAMITQIYERIEKLMRAGAEGGALGDAEVGLYTSLYLGMVKGCFVYDGLSEQRSPAMTLASTMVDVFLRGAGR